MAGSMAAAGMAGMGTAGMAGTAGTMGTAGTSGTAGTAGTSGTGGTAGGPTICVFDDAGSSFDDVCVFGDLGDKTMAIEFKIDIDAPKAGIRRLALFVALPLALIGATAAVAHATYDTTFATAGQPLKATPLKAALDEIQARLVAVETKPVVTVNGVAFGTSGTFVGLTAPTTGKWQSGSVFGYAAGKKLCEQVAGPAGPSPSAHVCSGAEIVRNLSAGVSILSAQNQAARIADANHYLDDRPTGTTIYGSDCLGYTSAVGQTAGATNYAQEIYFDTTAGVTSVTSGGCEASVPIACCD
jgi:hypothetical protein